MSDEYPIEIPESFIALHRVPGRIKLTASRAEIEARSELCEDMANHLYDYARARHFDLGISEDIVLERIHSGLLSAGSGVSEGEAGWVVRRLAELLNWACPQFTRPDA